MKSSKKSVKPRIINYIECTSEEFIKNVLIESQKDFVFTYKDLKDVPNFLKNQKGCVLANHEDLKEVPTDKELNWHLMFEEDPKRYSFPKFSDQWQSITYAISRESIEKCDISQFVRMLNDTNGRKEIDLSVSGYDEDPRTLEVIEEVKNYFKKLDNEVPSLYERLKASTIQLVSTCVYGSGMPLEENYKMGDLIHIPIDGESFYKRISPEVYEKLCRELNLKIS